MYPSVLKLVDTIRHYNPCAQPILFMTWGRKNGGMHCANDYCSPEFEDFTHMQDSLESAYVEIGEISNSYISPVGIAWKKVIENTNIDLHTADESHPNINGSYLAACVFHSIFWSESPVGNSYFPSQIHDTLALYLQQVADSVVFTLQYDWNLSVTNPIADFDYIISNNTVTFNNLSESIGEASYFWNFDDGNFSLEQNPLYNYSQEGIYDVSLIVTYCNNYIDTITKSIAINDVNTFNFSVYYHANNPEAGGSAPEDNNFYEENNEVTVQGQGTLDVSGYNFIAWNTEHDGTGISYQENDVFYMPANNVHLYAIWEIVINISSTKNSEFSVYPNPNNGHFFIDTDKIEEHITWTLYNINGTVIIYDDISKSKEIRLNDGSVLPGIYFLDIHNHSTNNSDIHKIFVK